MATTSAVEARVSALRAQLEGAISHHKRLAEVDHWLTIVLVTTAILASAAAGLGGLFLGWSAKTTGGIASIPGLLALAGSQLKLQGKSHWHYRKRDALAALLNR